MQKSNGLFGFVSKLQSTVMQTSKIMAIIAAIVLGVMMLLTVADVTGRYFFNYPINGSWEMIGFLLVCAGTWGLAFCQKQKAHIRVTVLSDLFPFRGRAIIDSIAYLFGSAAFAVICWRSVLLTIKYVVEKGHVTDTLQFPYYPFTIIMAIGTGLLAIMLLIHLIHSLVEIVRK